MTGARATPMSLKGNVLAFLEWTVDGRHRSAKEQRQVVRQAFEKGSTGCVRALVRSPFQT